MYNIEIFNTDFEFVSRCTVANVDYKYDYLVIEPTTIETPLIACNRGDYVCIEDVETNVKKWVYISGIAKTDTVCTLTVYPFLKKLDVDCYLRRSFFKYQALETSLKRMIDLTYVSTTDVEQKINGLIVIKKNTSGIAKLNIVSDINNIYTLLIKGLKKYNIAIDFVVDIPRKQIVAYIEKCSANQVTVELDLHNVYNVDIVQKDTYEMSNKIEISGVYAATSPDYGTVKKVTYYLDQDGSVTETPTTRVLPVVLDVQQFTIIDNFDDEAYELAYSKLYNQEYDNSISFFVSKNDNLIKLENFKIGQVANLIKNGTVYKSIFTGYEEYNDSIKFLFGGIRTDYTKLIKMERQV